MIQLKQMFRKKEEIEPVICDINIEAKIADLPVSLIRTSILLINYWRTRIMLHKCSQNTDGLYLRFVFSSVCRSVTN